MKDKKNSERIEYIELNVFFFFRGRKIIPPNRSCSSQLSVIVDLTAGPFDFKKLYNELSSRAPTNTEHHYYHFGGLRSYTIDFPASEDEAVVEQVIDKLKSIQAHTSLLPPFWISHKKILPQVNVPCLTALETIKKNVKLGAFRMNEHFHIHYCAGALTQLNRYNYDVETQISDAWSLTFYHDRIDLDYGPKDEKLRKTFKADMMDRCAVRMSQAHSLTIFINMTGNPIDYKSKLEHLNSTSSSRLVAYHRTAPPQAQPFYSTIRLVLSLSDEQTSSEAKQQLHKCQTQFIEFFQRNHIHDCIGVIHSKEATREPSTEIQSLIDHDSVSFLKQYCWQMLLSIGFRFQQRLTKRFVRQMNQIADEDEFYQTSLHIWRRSSEYYFISLVDELRRYREKIANLVALSAAPNSIQADLKKEDLEHQRWSIHRPPQHYAYVPSVTLTPTTICVNPFKLVKTNRVLRESKFGGHLMFSLVDIRDENRTMDIFPHDYRSLRWKIEMLLESGFHLGQKDRIYRYLHHSQSQLKDKQFWFYHHDGKTNFSFEQAFEWMGDFQDEKIVAKHAARIAQCFTSAEATIKVPAEQVEYIEDIHTEDSKYNFTDGVGTMSTKIRDSINPHRQFSAIQIRYGGCKGVISVNPDLDNSPHQLRIRQSMKKFKCDHDILELCRISKPRPLYLNRQIIVLLSHRGIDDRKFLMLQNEHQKFLSQTLVHPGYAYELLNEKLNRKLFRLRDLVQEAQLNLIQEPFFRQLIITFGKFELGQMRERTKLKLPKNSARNMIGVVDEYGILEYGQVFIQCTELVNDDGSNKEPGTFILTQKVVVTKNPCHHPGDIRVFNAIDVPQLRHLKDVIVFPQKGKRPHPNEISGSDLDGDEYAVIWDPSFVPTTPDATPFDYECQVPLLRIVGRSVNRTDIQKTVLDISEQSCVGKLCSLHLAFTDLYGVAHEKTLAIAGHISQELDSAKTGHHPLEPKDIARLQTELNNERPDYFDKPYYKLYPSKHVLGQLFRSCLRFEPNWLSVQTPPTTVAACPIDPLLVHDTYAEHMVTVAELARIYREAIMDIMYVYRFSSDIDLLCRFNAASPQYKAAMSKQQIESPCLIADSAQVEYKQLIERMERLFFENIPSASKKSTHRCHKKCKSCAEKNMAKASALYIYCYTDVSHARRILSLPWLFADLLIATRKLNIEKQTKLLSPNIVSQMLAIQPFRLIGQSLRHAARFLIETKKSFYFQHVYSTETPDTIKVFLAPNSDAKRLCIDRTIPLIDYFLIECLHHYVVPYLSDTASSLTAPQPALVKTIWQHLLTRFVFEKCSPLVLVPSSSTTAESSKLFENDFQFWSDEQAWNALQRLIECSTKCADDGPSPTDYAHANEYLISALQQMATTGSLFS